MITIDQLLESVDLDFEPRWVTQDADSSIWMWREKPRTYQKKLIWNSLDENREPQGINISNNIKLAEFDGKDWTECIYEVPQTTTDSKKELVGKIEKLKRPVKIGGTTFRQKINELVDAVNEINENYACIAALTDIRKRLDTLEKYVKNKRGEE